MFRHRVRLSPLHAGFHESPRNSQRIPLVPQFLAILLRQTENLILSGASDDLIFGELFVILCCRFAQTALLGVEQASVLLLTVLEIARECCTKSFHRAAAVAAAAVES